MWKGPQRQKKNSFAWNFVPGVYVANLTQHEVKSAGDVFALLEVGKQHLVIAETKMVRHSSR